MKLFSGKTAVLSECINHNIMAKDTCTTLQKPGAVADTGVIRLSTTARFRGVLYQNLI